MQVTNQMHRIKLLGHIHFLWFKYIKKKNLTIRRKYVYWIESLRLFALSSESKYFSFPSIFLQATL